MVCALVVETSVTNNSLFQDSNHTDDHFESKQCAKSVFAATTLKFVAAHMSARLNWETFVSAAKFTQKRFPV